MGMIREAVRTITKRGSIAALALAGELDIVEHPTTVTNFAAVGDEFAAVSQRREWDSLILTSWKKNDPVGLQRELNRLEEAGAHIYNVYNTSPGVYRILWYRLLPNDVAS